MMPVIVPIVEGASEVESVPVLLRRILQQARQMCDSFNKFARDVEAMVACISADQEVR